VARTVKKIDKPASSARSNNPTFLQSSNKTDLRGVYRHGEHSWRVLIYEHGKLKHIGTFPSQELAAEAYAVTAACRAEKFERAKAVIQDMRSRLAHSTVNEG
jgi:AP2 domain